MDVTEFLAEFIILWIKSAIIRLVLLALPTLIQSTQFLYVYMLICVCVTFKCALANRSTYKDFFNFFNCYSHDMLYG